MSDASVVRQTRVGYGKQGQDVLSDEAFMQFQISFMKDGALRALRGAPLSAFVAVGLHEAEVLLGIAEPFTLKDIIDVTNYSKPVTVRALDYLVDTRFVEELPGRGTRNEKRYRIAAYMWFGTGRPRVTSRAKSPDPKEGKDSLLSPSKSKKFTDPPHDDDEYTNPETLENKHHHHNTASVREILQGGGFQGRRLDEIAGLVTEEEARACVDWIAQALQVPDQFRAPFGYVYTLAKTHSIAALPAIQSKQKKTWYDPQYAKFIHGNPEHTQYCREHPEDFDCDCGTITFEDE